MILIWTTLILALVLRLAVKRGSKTANSKQEGVSRRFKQNKSQRRPKRGSKRIRNRRNRQARQGGSDSVDCIECASGDSNRRSGGYKNSGSGGDSDYSGDSDSGDSDSGTDTQRSWFAMKELSSNWKKLQATIGKSGDKANTKGNKVTKAKVSLKKTTLATSKSGSKTSTSKAASTTPSISDPDDQSTMYGLDSIGDGSDKVLTLSRKFHARDLGKLLNVEDTALQQGIVNRSGTPTGTRMGRGRYVAIDCEFVGVGREGADSALARVSIVNYYGHVLMDEFVRPRERVTDWRTWVSGVTSRDMIGAMTFEQSQQQVESILRGSIVVGHALHNDFKVLMISVPKSLVRDTSSHRPFRKLVRGAPSLKVLSEKVLKMDIQSGEHSSVEDAQASMLLYRLNRRAFEAQKRR